MGFPGAFGVTFPVALLQVAVIFTVVQETAISVINLLAGRGWQSPSARVLAAGSSMDWIDAEDFDSTGFGGRSAVAELAAEIRASLPVILFGDIVNKFSCGDEEGAQCSVCLCDFNIEETVLQTPRCSHVFHKDCLDRWLEQHQTTCPLCRSSLASPELSEHGRIPTMQVRIPDARRIWWQEHLDGYPALGAGLH